MNAVVRSIVILAVALSSTVTPCESFAYYIEYPAGTGDRYYGRVDADRGPDYHWDEMTWTYDPATGVQRFSDGNTYGYSSIGEFLVLPDPGEPTTGTVQLLVGVSAGMQKSLSFDNFEELPFDYSYTYSVYGGSRVQVPPGVSQVVLDVPINSPLTVGASVAAGPGLHSAMGFDGPTPDYPLWEPAVIDPSIPGRAHVSTSGSASLRYIQIVPEPTTFALLGIGSLVLVMVRRKS